MPDSLLHFRAQTWQSQCSLPCCPAAQNQAGTGFYRGGGGGVPPPPQPPTPAEASAGVAVRNSLEDRGIEQGKRARVQKHGVPHCLGYSSVTPQGNLGRKIKCMEGARNWRPIVRHTNVSLASDPRLSHQAMVCIRHHGLCGPAPVPAAQLASLDMNTAPRGRRCHNAG